MNLKTLRLSTLKPYENNPRINDNAVEAVKESILQCGYIAPIIVDENMVILAGHTRYRALTEMNVESCEVIVKEGLAEEQKKKYRILDNKTNEFARWDFEKLFEELEDLDFGEFDFGFDTVNELDVSMFETDEEKQPKEKEQKTITCPHCGKVIEV